MNILIVGLGSIAKKHIDAIRTLKIDARIYALRSNQNAFIEDKIENILKLKGIEYRRGLAGGGNQLRQPYLKTFEGIPLPDSLPNVDFIHNFSWYIGNYPNIDSGIYTELKDLVDTIS